jgi:O-antigen/teichoic acid export membrane protein
LVVWSTSTAAIGCVAFIVIARRLLPGALFGRVLDWPAIQSLTRFGASVAARQTLGNLLLLFERVWIVRTLGASALTFYAVPMLVALSLHAFIASSALSFYPLASEAYARDDLEGLRVGYSRALKIAAPLIALPVVTLTVVGAPLLTLWMGPEFAERSATVLSVHAVTFGIVALMVVPWQTADALGRPGWNATLSLVWLLVGGVLMVGLTPRFGIVGAAAARLLGLVAVPFYAARIEKWLFGAVQWRFWARTLGLLAVAGGGAGVLEMALLPLLVPGWNVAAACAGGALVFLGILRGLGYLEHDERKWLGLRVAALVGRTR